jgi:hypothetical protein
MTSEIPFKDVEKSRISPSSQERKKQKRSPPKFSYDCLHPFFFHDANAVFRSEPGVIVTFLIGPDPSPTKFIVHKEIACYHSKVFNAAFNSEFIEGQTQTYRLEDTSEEAFRLLVQWLYAQKLDLLPSKAKKFFSEEALAEDMHLAELWVLADKLCMRRLQNMVLTHIEGINIRAHFVAVETFHYVYDNTAGGSPLRRYLVRICALDLQPSAFTEFVDDFPKSMLVDIAEYFSKLRKGTLDDEDGQKGDPISAFYVPVDED